MLVIEMEASSSRKSIPKEGIRPASHRVPEIRAMMPEPMARGVCTTPLAEFVAAVERAE